MEMPWTFHLRETHRSTTEPEPAADADPSGRRIEAERATPERMHEGDETQHGEHG